MTQESGGSHADNFALLYPHHSTDNLHVNSPYRPRHFIQDRWHSEHERTYLTALHHLSVLQETKEEVKILRDIEFITSRLADRELVEGQVVHLTDGYFYVDKVFSEGGAYVAVLRDFTEKAVPKVICRGTTIRHGAKERVNSLIDDLQWEMGSRGVKTIWPSFSDYLQENQISSVQVLGKSLGGAHAQLLTILLEGQQVATVEKLTTYCSVGVGERVHELFAGSVLKHRTTPLQIEVVRNSEDFIPTLGGAHLGYQTPADKCTIKLYYIHPDKERVQRSHLGVNFLTSLFHLILSFLYAHNRQSTLEDFSFYLVDQSVMNEYLASTHLETLRKCVAYILHVLTLGYLNNPSFSDFFAEQQIKNALV